MATNMSSTGEILSQSYALMGDTSDFTDQSFTSRPPLLCSSPSTNISYDEEQPPEKRTRLTLSVSTSSQQSSSDLLFQQQTEVIGCILLHDSN